MPALRFRVDENHFENGAFRELQGHDNHMVSRVFLKHKSKIAGDCYVFNFLRAKCGRKTFDTFSE